MNVFSVARLDAAMRYHDLPGREPALVFLHGLGSASSASFPRIARDPSLSDFRTLLVDLLGYGFSDRPTSFSYTMEDQAEVVAQLLRSIHVENAMLVGHSMGGSIAVLVAAGQPELVGHLVSAEGNLDPGPGFVSGIIAAVDEAEFAATGHQQFIRRVAAAGYLEFAGTAAIADPLALHRSAASLIADRSPTYREALAGLPLPKSYLFGERTLPDPDADRLRAAGVDVRIVPRAGHDMMTDNPRGFAEVVAQIRASHR